MRPLLISANCRTMLLMILLKTSQVSIDQTDTMIGNTIYALVNSLYHVRMLGIHRKSYRRCWDFLLILDSSSRPYFIPRYCLLTVTPYIKRRYFNGKSKWPFLLGGETSMSTHGVINLVVYSQRIVMYRYNMTLYKSDNYFYCTEVKRSWKGFMLG